MQLTYEIKLGDVPSMWHLLMLPISFLGKFFYENLVVLVTKVCLPYHDEKETLSNFANEVLSTMEKNFQMKSFSC